MSVEQLPGAMVTTKSLKEVLLASIDEESDNPVEAVIILTQFKDGTFTFTASSQEAREAWWVLTRAVEWFRKNFVGI